MEASDYSFVDDARENLEYLNFDTRVNFKIGENAPAGLDFSRQKEINFKATDVELDNSFEVLEENLNNSATNIWNMPKTELTENNVVSIKFFQTIFER